MSKKNIILDFNNLTKTNVETHVVNEALLLTIVSACQLTIDDNLVTDKEIKDLAYKIKESILNKFKDKGTYKKEEVLKYLKHINSYLQNVRSSSVLLFISLMNYFINEKEDYKKANECLLPFKDEIKFYINDFLYNKNEEYVFLVNRHFTIVKILSGAREISYQDYKVYLSIKDEIENNVKSFYGDSLSHGFTHVRDVVINALEINSSLGLCLNPVLLIIAGYYHDIYSLVNRKDHHILASNYILENKDDSVINVLTDEDKEIVSKAILEHRASFNGEFSSEYSEVISTADRDAPDINIISKRAFLTVMEKYLEDNNSLLRHLGFSEDALIKYKKYFEPGYWGAVNANFLRDEVRNDIINFYYCGKKDLNSIIDILSKMTYLHLIEKFSRKGYIRYPEMYIKIHSLRLDKLYEDIEAIKSIEDFKKILKNNDCFKILKNNLNKG